MELTLDNYFITFIPVEYSATIFLTIFTLWNGTVSCKPLHLKIKILQYFWYEVSKIISDIQWHHQLFEIYLLGIPGPKCDTERFGYWWISEETWSSGKLSGTEWLCSCEHSLIYRGRMKLLFWKLNRKVVCCIIWKSNYHLCQDPINILGI